MTNKKLQEYLSKFEEDSDIAIIAADPGKRKVYQCNTMAIADSDTPVFIFGITGERDINEVEKEVCEECERQPELPEMKNNTQRKEFLSSYHNWPVWFLFQKQMKPITDTIFRMAAVL